MPFIAHGQQLEKHSAMRTTTTLSAGGWWWTENRAPMMMSPGMCANTLLSVFWALAPAWCLRPSWPRSATRKMVSASRLTQSPVVNPMLLTLLPSSHLFDTSVLLKSRVRWLICAWHGLVVVPKNRDIDRKKIRHSQIITITITISSCVKRFEQMDK